MFRNKIDEHYRGCLQSLPHTTQKSVKDAVRRFPRSKRTFSGLLMNFAVALSSRFSSVSGTNARFSKIGHPSDAQNQREMDAWVAKFISNDIMLDVV